MYIAMLSGLFVHGFVVLPLIFSLVTRTLPFRFIANMANAINVIGVTYNASIINI